MTKEQEERLVSAWEAIAERLGELNETARIATSKQWPDPRQPREAVYSRIPTPEDRLKERTGNTDKPLEEWLQEFKEEEEEFGPREKDFLERQAKKIESTKTTTKTS